MLADMALHDPETFKQVVQTAMAGKSA
jgi:hypothetical protein